MKTVVGLYDHFEDAERVVQALRDAGFSQDDISLIARDTHGEYAKYLEGSRQGKSQNIADGTAKGAGIGAVLGGLGGLLVGLGLLAIPGIGPVLAAGPIVTTIAGAGAGAVAGGIVGALVDLGVPKEHAQYYAEGIRRGGTLVVLRSEDDMADQATDIMNRFNPVDINERASSWQKDNWKGYDENAEPLETDQMEFNHSDIPVTGSNQDMTIPVVQEDINIGKRQVDRGGVRINTYETEEPVDQDINLREEHVNVERRPVDRPATDKDMNAFKEGTYEFKETAEEPVVQKTTRVTEEVHVNKDVEETQQHIHDTVRRRDVDVQRTDQDFSRWDNDFQRNYQQMYASSGRDYAYYQPAYRYGYTLANDPRYKGYDWARMEPVARQDWQRQGMKGKWEDFKAAVQYAWDRARS